MIFVTVGTSVKPFDRLVMEVDALKGRGAIQEAVFIQLGKGIYLPKHCQYERLISFDEMVNRFHAARLTITHGAPASVILALRGGKLPIVVPRQLRYDEHVTDHQVHFTRELERRGKVVAVYDIGDLASAITARAQLPALQVGPCTQTHDAYIGKLNEISANLCGTAGI